MRQKQVDVNGTPDSLGVAIMINAALRGRTAIEQRCDWLENVLL